MDDERLVRAVQRRSALYDRGDPKYSNRDAVRTLWLDCAAELEGEVYPTKKRWAYLRDYFMKQYRAMKYSKPGHSAKKKRWPLYETMSFLIPYIEERQALGQLEPDGVLSPGDTDDVMENVHLEDSSCSLQDYKPDLTPFAVEPLPPSRPDSPLDPAIYSTPPALMDGVGNNLIGSSSSSANNHHHYPHHHHHHHHHKGLKRRRPSAGGECDWPRLHSSMKRPCPISPGNPSSYACEPESLLNTSSTNGFRESAEDLDGHDMFFKSLLPMVRNLEPVAGLEFRIEVQSTLLRYVKANQASLATTTTTSYNNSNSTSTNNNE